MEFITLTVIDTSLGEDNRKWDRKTRINPFYVMSWEARVVPKIVDTTGGRKALGFPEGSYVRLSGSDHCLNVRESAEQIDRLMQKIQSPRSPSSERDVA